MSASVQHASGSSFRRKWKNCWCRSGHQSLKTLGTYNRSGALYTEAGRIKLPVRGGAKTEIPVNPGQRPKLGASKFNKGATSAVGGRAARSCPSRSQLYPVHRISAIRPVVLPQALILVAAACLSGGQQQLRYLPHAAGQVAGLPC